MNHAGSATRMILVGAIVCSMAGLWTSSNMQAAESAAPWPDPTVQNRPWTRWWWMGSAVDEKNLTALLSQYQQAGIGGVEICPIYGVKGYEEQFVDFLSPAWMSLLEHTLREGQRLGIGVDLTAGSGWPFGGPMVTNETASSGVILKRHELENGHLTERLPKEPVAYLAAVSDQGERIDVTRHVRQQTLEWTAPAGNWTLYAAAVKNPVQKVKRPAPGGEGYVLDPYSVSAIDSYLEVFDRAFDGYDGPLPRAYFHDSFEYYGANWTPDFFAAFQARRGYDLRDHIEALFGDGPKETAARVLCDYHETIHELHVEFIGRWTDWCRQRGSLSRNQAHGAPANLVDLYAASDIPETEIFRKVDEQQIPMLKFSSSAAHLKGQPLASAESFTWLKEHFQTSPGDLKNATDFLFLTGVNHLFYHGIPYSPQEAPWPGWQFYASVNFGPGGGLWHDLPAFNAYVTRCQSILQGGQPDNDILLYLPIYDLWQQPDVLHMAFTVHNQPEWLYPSAFHRAAMTLWEKGYAYDAVSDAFLAKAACGDGQVVINGNAYAVIVVPRCEVMRPETLQHLLKLAREGATVVFEESLPADVPGLADLQQRRVALRQAIEAMSPAPDQQRKQLGSGWVMVGRLESMLKEVSVARETAMEAGIRFIRRSRDDGFDYFLVNRSERPFDGWMTLGKPALSAVLMDPLLTDRYGLAAVRQNDAVPEVYLQLDPGQSVILRTFTEEKDAPAWQYVKPEGRAKRIQGTWKVQFIDGGPELPQPYQTSELTSWTLREGEASRRFFGTARYTIEFNHSPSDADDWLLDLGRVCESARVRLNGVDLGTLWARPFQLHVGKALAAGKNVLEIDVTNSAANRIRHMDQTKVNWKYFYDINVVNVDYKPLDASNWPLFDSGLLGPVQLRPLSRLEVHPQANPVERRSVFIIGDSTVHNTGTGLQGWGDVIADFFDSSKVTVHNHALGGRSSRTFQTEGLWDKVVESLQPGDFVLMQFGHNDGGPLNTGRARASLKGVGEETKEVIMEATGQKEIVHTYGWYMRKYILDTKAKGAVPIVFSPVPRNIWKDGKVARASNDYGRWAADAAKDAGAFFVDLNELIAQRYERIGPDQVSSRYFLEDRTHTTPAGAALNAEAVTAGIAQLENCALHEFIR